MIIRRAGRLMGSKFLDDLGAFLLDIREVLGGFLARAREIEAVLKRPDVGFVLVLTPAAAAIDEALFFAGRLRETGSPLCCFIANRTLPEPSRETAQSLAARFAPLPELAGLPPEELARASAKLAELGDFLFAIAQAQRQELERLARSAPGIDITTVPLLPHDVSNIDSLRAIADRLASA